MKRGMTIAAIAAAGLAGLAVPASADDAVGDASFATSLNGANVASAAGDRDGSAVAFLGVQGDQVSFAIQFNGIAIPTSGDLHQGAKGSTGDVKVSFFTTRLLTGRNSVSGTVRVTDKKFLANL